MRISKGHYAPQAEDPDPVPAHCRLSEHEMDALMERTAKLMERKEAEAAAAWEKKADEARSALLDEL